MSIKTPLTATNDIQLAQVSRTEQTSSATQVNEIKPNLGVFAKDVLEISKLGIEKQQKETEVNATRSIEGIANEVIRISSSIGRAQSTGNLTSTQATNLYQKIASLM